MAGVTHAAQPYAPPATFEDKKDISTWFGRIKSTGKWCVFDRQPMERRSKRDELIPGEFGWARFDGRRLRSVTYAQESEDAYVEDRYFIGPQNEVVKMVRTGHYISDPWVSVTFEPDSADRLRLSASSKQVLGKMSAAGQETYFADWDHFSKLAQIPFAKLLNFEGSRTGSNCP